MIPVYTSLVQKLAGTIFFEIMERLETPFVAPPKPDSITVLDVCAQTGMIPTAACTDTISTLALKTRIPTQQCDEHHHIFVDPKGFRSAPSCTTEPLTSQSVWVPSMGFQRWSKLPVSLPPLASNCSGKATLDSGLQIDSPKPNHRILLLDDGQNNLSHLKPSIMIHMPNSIGTLTMNSLAVVKEPQKFWWTPTEGSHTIAAEDAHGNSDLITVQVDRFSNVKTD